MLSDLDIGFIFDEINKISKKNIELNLRGNFSSLEKSKYSVVKLLNGNSSGAGVLINYNEENFILTVSCCCQIRPFHSYFSLSTQNV